MYGGTNTPTNKSSEDLISYQQPPPSLSSSSQNNNHQDDVDHFRDYDYDEQQGEQEEEEQMMGSGGGGGGGLSLSNMLGSSSSQIHSFAEKRRQKRIILLVVVSLILIFVVIAAFIAALVIPRVITYFKNRKEKCHFSAIVLGSRGGGLTEENLSGVLLSRNTSNGFLALDAGNLLYGIRSFLKTNDMLSNTHAKANGYIKFPFPGWTKGSSMKRAGFVLRNHVWGYLLGHAHLDHITGLILNSPEDFFTDTNQMISNTSKRLKPIVGTESTIHTLETSVFNDELWPNLVKKGDQYRYVTVDHGSVHQVNSLLELTTDNRHPNLYESWRDVTVKVLPLCHGTVNSTAYLFDASVNSDQVLYFSDTGPSVNDDLSKCSWEQRLNSVWSDESLKVDTLRGVFIEVSISNDTPESELYGHLRPTDLIKSLNSLKNLRSMDSMSHITIVIQHIIPSFDSGEDVVSTIQRQIADGADKYDIDAQFVYPEQGEFLCL